MRPSTAIFLLIILQANASYFDEFTRAMSSVETAFGKLLNDVVADVKTTLHCTILSVRKVLAISGAVKEPPVDDCYGESDSKNDNGYKLPLGEPKAASRSGSAKDMSKQISASISRVNKTLINILDNVNHDRINHIKTVLQNETSRLTEISLLLRQELNKISQRVKNDFQHSIDSDKSSLESIWNDLKILHDVEKSDKNVTEVKEISQVLNKALDVLHLNKTKEVHSDDDKMKVIIQELEHETPNKNNTFKSIDRELSKWKEEGTRLQNYSCHDWLSKETPTSLKDVTTKIFSDKDRKQKEIDDLTNRSENKIHNKNLYNEETQGGPKETEPANCTDSDFFGGLSEEEQNKAIDEAEDIINDNVRLENILDNIFSKGKRDGVDVCNGSESFNFSNFK